MIELKHGDRVRLATWVHPYDRTTVDVVTVRGSTADHNATLSEAMAQYHEDPEAAYFRARTNGHQTAWTYQGGNALTDSKAYYEAMKVKEAADLARAILLAPGDVVQIEGERFTVQVARGNEKVIRNSDPIHFIRTPV